MKHKESITQQKQNREIYSDSQKLEAILNKYYQKVFTKQTEFKQQEETEGTRMCQIEVSGKGIQKLLSSGREKSDVTR